MMGELYTTILLATLLLMSVNCENGGLNFVYVNKVLFHDIQNKYMTEENWICNSKLIKWCSLIEKTKYYKCSHERLRAVAKKTKLW